MKMFAIVMASFMFWGCGDEPAPKKSNANNPNTGSDVTGVTGNGGTTGGSVITNGRLRYPLVLHHGFMDGAKFGSFGDMAKVFKGNGIQVYGTEVSTANTIAIRGQQLATQIQKILSETGAAKVNIIAHSMGGLDSRHVISTLGLGGKIASLTTLSTPHRGTPVADGAAYILPFYSDTMLNMMVGLFGKVTNGSGGASDVKGAVANLSEKFITGTFNPQTPDNSAVYYQSYGAKTCIVTGLGCKDKINMMMQMSWTALKLKSGDNDGMVPVESSKWGNFRGVLDADHIDLTGRTYLSLGPSGIDYPQFLQGVVDDLGSRGY